MRSTPAGSARRPYSAVNSGFTNLPGGYTSIPNTELDAETSDNVEVGVRSAVGRVSVGVTGFLNGYDNFILQVQRGVNPATRLLEFQYQNLSKVTIKRRRAARRGASRRRAAPPRQLRASFAATTFGADGRAAQLHRAGPGRRRPRIRRAVAAAGARKRWCARSRRSPRAARRGDRVLRAGALCGGGSGRLDRIANRLTLRAGVLNLTDAKYFEWSNVRGRLATDTTIDRYTSPGISGVFVSSYGW